MRLIIALLLMVLPSSLLLAGSARWATELAAFTSDSPKPEDVHRPVIFVGSSSIRLWASLQNDFPASPCLNRGFGGSRLSEVALYFETLVLRHNPQQVVVYAGENDLAEGATPEDVFAAFDAICRQAHVTYPTLPLIYVSIKPSPSRWHLQEAITRTNGLIAARCASDPCLTFVDVYTPMLNAEGQPRAELFSGDQLHMNAAGYALWSRLLSPALAKTSTAPASVVAAK